MKDIVIIGSGPGGYVAAIRGAQLGADVCLIERDKLGGTCLNRGCIPTKAFYKNAEVMNTINNSNSFGITIDSYSVDVKKIQDRKNNIVNKLVSGVEKLLESNNIKVIKGNGSIIDNNTVLAQYDNGHTEEIKTKNIIIATGSYPKLLPIEGINEDGVLTTKEMLEIEYIPNNLVIIGGGVVGMEFASIFNALGSNVSVIEFLPNILNQVDKSISKRYKTMAKKKGISIYTSSKVTRISKQNNQLEVLYDSKNKEKKIIADTVMIAAGRAPNYNELNLENSEIKYNKDGIFVNDYYETTVKGIYAIGDVNGKSMLAHVASHQGIKAVEKIMGLDICISKEVVPSCIFVFPEIAFVGISEEEAKERNIEVNVGKYMFSANGKAMTLGEEEGFIKIISSCKDDSLLGVHILGAHASDLIHEGAIAIKNKLNVEQIINTIHAHPTLGEAFHEATLDTKGMGLHILPKK
ncbi:MAG: dihydrolipoyl dehydrogenase [Vallitalea sp.]|jgi:dihydrolipoamide dehydrogenase|nr:dihydrolipoyl dehydrogenase [Vallitalea sp.]